MARAAALSALVASLLACAVALGASVREREPAATADARAMVPNLRAVREMAAPSGRSRDAGIGIYPALSRTGELAFPSPAAVRDASRFAAGRQGRIAFAVADARGGISGRAFDQRYSSASLVKAMILVASLERAEREGDGLAAAEEARLDDMIRVSDNDAASTAFRRLGPARLNDLAHRAGMRSFSVGPNWADAQVTAADQVRFFLALDRLLPWPERRGFARDLLESVMPLQAWGIPAAGRPRWRVFFKGGWRPNGGGDIVHQAALLERGGRRLAIAVLSDGNPSQAYGEQTVRGIADRLLEPVGPPTLPPAEPGQLAPLQALDGAAPPQPRRLRPLAAYRLPGREVGSSTVYFSRGRE